MKTKLLSLLLAAALLLALCPAALAAELTVDEAAEAVCAYLYETVPAPGVDAIGGDWVPFVMLRCGWDVPEDYLSAYLERVEAAVTAKEGVLHPRKYSDNSRVILSLTALGIDPRDYAGYDLTAPLADAEKTAYQGINGPIWALIALDSAGYDIPKAPEGATQATRQLYVERILEVQQESGGWALSKDPDVDLTAMALQALAPYRDQPRVAAAVERGLDWLASAQTARGGFASMDVENAESTCQVILALCALGLGPEEPRFNGGVSLLNALLSYRMEDGSFRHTMQTGSNLMATQQAALALTAVKRFRAGLDGVYALRSVLDARAAVVTPVPVTWPCKSFEDIAGHPAKAVIEALAERAIIHGMTDALFEPDASMTRAQFAAIIVRGLGLTPKSSYAFADVPDSAWFAPYVGTASRVGIVNGVSATSFNPNGTITRQEAATMIARAAKLCGFSGAGDPAALSAYADAGEAADWALPSLAFCVEEEIFKPEGALCPKQPILRWEIADMLWRLLNKVGLL